MTQRQEGGRRTLWQRRWTTGFDILKTRDDLEQKIYAASINKGVRTRSHVIGDPNRVAFTGLGIVQHGKYKVPAVSTPSGQWYALQPTEAATGTIHDSSLYEKQEGIGAFVNGILPFLKGQRSVLVNDKTSAAYNARKPITLEQALAIPVKHIPVYQGTTLEFSAGIFRKAAPMDAKVTNDGAVQVAGVIGVQPEDYRTLSNYLFNEKRQPPSVITEKKVAPEPNKAEKGAQEALTVLKKPVAPEKQGYSTKPESITSYTAWLKPREPVKGAVETTQYAKIALRTQETFDTGTLPKISGLDTALEDVFLGDFEPRHVSIPVEHIEQRHMGKGKNSTVWIAYAPDREAGKNALGFYVILPPANDVIEVVHEGKGRVKEIHPARPISFGLNYWPNDEVSANSVRNDDLWMLRANSDLIIEGYAARPTTSFIYDGARMLGVAGMRPQTWRKMLVKKTVNELIEFMEARNNGRQKLVNGLDEVALRASSTDIYGRIPGAQLYAPGGAEKFAASVVDEVKSRGISVANAEKPLQVR